MAAPRTPAEVAKLDQDHAGYVAAADFLIEEIRTKYADRSAPQAAANVSRDLFDLFEANGVPLVKVIDMVSVALVELIRRP